MYLRITATPDAKKETLVQVTETHWRISVKEEAIQNRANDRIIVLIARELGVPTNAVRILTGHHSRSKMISVATD
ncbi:MAG: DUF167 domain-containing protein [Patescibacteria group bacterium]